MTYSATINAATHKRVFYRIKAGDNEKVQQDCTNLANLINKYNGRVYGTSPMTTSGNIEYSKVMMSFEIPTIAVEQFLNEEQALGRDSSENTAKV